MIVIILTIALCLTLVYFYRYKTKSKLKNKIQALHPAINKQLSLEESYAFLDLVREITLELVELSQKQSNLKEITNKLLGFVLTIPRLNESTDDTEPLAQAIYQMEVVIQTTKELQDYLKQHYHTLIKIVK